MKKRILTLGYVLALGGMITLNSCQDDPIEPNPDGNGNGADTTWVDDSTNNGGIDDPNGNGTDSTIIDDGGNGEGTIDSTGTDGGNIDSTWVNDSLGG